MQPFKLIKILFIVLIISTSVHAQLRIENTEILFEAGDGYIFPSYGTDGDQILLSEGNLAGLKLYTRPENRIVEISDTPGSGFGPAAGPDGQILYREDSYINRRKYTSCRLYDISAGTSREIAAPDRDLSQAVFGTSAVFFQNNGVIKRVGLALGETKGIISDTVLISSGSRLTLVTEGGMKVIQPLGEGHYIWGKLSPDRQSILFTKAGTGTFICDLDGRNLRNIGRVQAPDWSYNGRYLVYMIQEDDGTVYTASDIFIMDLETGARQKVTDTPDEIEMYPRWAPDRLSILYQSETGGIYETVFSVAE